MLHDASHQPVQQEDRVEDTIATRFLGIILGILLVVSAVSIQHTLGWHPVAGGVVTGLLGMIFGALGTSVRSPMSAAILGWAGAIAFFTSIAMFFGLRLW